jgi:hypothetical protein
MSISTMKKKALEKEKSLFKLTMVNILLDAIIVVHQDMQIQLHFTSKIKIHHSLFGMLYKLAINLHSKLKMATTYQYAPIVGTDLAKNTMMQFLFMLNFQFQMLYGLQSHCKMVNGFLKAIINNTLTDVTNVFKMELMKIPYLLKLKILKNFK